ncbi:tumor necrosis factor receptor superfamily member 6B-like [Hippoglossus hippoglossus]|uniref:tumor necrosis factor receptor superfamily member 6B-like n=1 Tax=Hippoglossus hippoglossus TaxID=8267 RepID=UPI00148B6622|nr:tumor necrosis factor receptor superfamily member 6B-like [Hippoglossus hippoglossus]
MLFLQLLLLSGVLSAVPAVDPLRTFQFRSPRTGEDLTCDRCPPGTHMTAHCTASTATQCAACRREHFTELWNHLSRCLYCDSFCTANQEVETECSALSNRVCRCKEGFYWANDFCMRHSECEPGDGVRTQGTLQKNTVCEQCSDGYFSNSSSALETCVRHQECAVGQIVLLPGSVYHDSVCGTCEELANGGETLRTVLSDFFSMHRMRVVKMRRFVTRYINSSAPRQRGPLMHLITAWLAQAPEEQLRKLPQMLKASHLKNIAEKLEKRLMEIQQQSPSCSLNLLD